MRCNGVAENRAKVLSHALGGVGTTFLSPAENLQQFGTGYLAYRSIANVGKPVFLESPKDLARVRLGPLGQLLREPFPGDEFESALFAIDPD